VEDAEIGALASLAGERLEMGQDTIRIWLVSRLPASCSTEWRNPTVAAVLREIIR
jgi:hypothetical protein